MKSSKQIAAFIAAPLCAVAVAQSADAAAGVDASNNREQPGAATPGTTRTSPSTGTQSTYQSGTLSAAGAVTDNFIKGVSQSNNAEMATAQYALANSQNPQVKLFAQQMLADHGKAERALQDLASRRGITVPTDIDMQHKQAVDSLQRRRGTDFDLAYARAMVKDHQQVAALFKQTAQNQHVDADLRGFAQQLLPTIQDHLTMANRMLDAIAVKKVSLNQ